MSFGPTVRSTYRRRVFRINAGAIQKHAALIDEGRILVVVVPDVDCQRGRGRESFADVPCPILQPSN